MVPAPHLVDRFARDLNALISADKRVGIAVSGGPDSLALLLLAAAARPGMVEAATVDHGLRPEAAAEAAMVSGLCDKLGVRHVTLAAQWLEKPSSAIQEQARTERYRLLSKWAGERTLDAVATGHHADDQAETFLMRLARGAGVRGLAGMRALATVPGSDLPLLRPLLQWRRIELEELCRRADVAPVHDPSNDDAAFERVRARRALASSDILDPEALASSAAHLGSADAALEWVTDQEWDHAVQNSAHELLYRPGGAPQEIRRRIVSRIIGQLASEGNGELRGRELDRLLDVLGAGGTATLRGVLGVGGDEWRFTRAPKRRT
jgi:tRNA(Ile)-lysidine synthase